MRHRGPPTDGLSEVEAAVLAGLESGLTRAAVAAERGVTPAAITHTTHRLERKGYKLPPAHGGPEQASPTQDRAAPMFRAGKGAREVAAELGISLARAYRVRHRIEQREAKA